jgi:hypothetical protein
MLSGDPYTPPHCFMDRCSDRAKGLASSRMAGADLALPSVGGWLFYDGFFVALAEERSHQ